MRGSRRMIVFGVFGLVVLLGASLGFSSLATGGSAGASPLVDLGIADTSGLARPGLQAFGEPVNRPGILIAWRNSAQIRETEVRVRNLGARAGTGRVTVEILDAEHSVLESQPSSEHPFVVELPSRVQGGDTGVVVQVPGTYQKNRLLDDLDRARHPYCIRIRLDTLAAQDANPLDNVAVKCYNTAAKMVSNGVSFHEYVFRNDGRDLLDGNIRFERSDLPRGWTMEARPEPGSAVSLRPGEVLRGSILVRGPEKVTEGAHVDIRPMLVSRSGEVVDKSEFLVVSDTRAPEFTEAFLAPGTVRVDAPAETAAARNTVYVNLRAVDSVSGVAEASGASVVYSTDAGFTRTQRTMAYSDGNFTAPTGFDTDIGPFPDGTVIEVFAVVRDVAGNEMRTKPVKVTVPLLEQINLV